MTFSPLVDRTVETSKYSSRHGHSIEWLVIHHTAGGTNEFAVKYLSEDNGVTTSATYVLCTTGELVGIVPEEHRQWTTGWIGDRNGVTVETVNSSGPPLWMVTDEQIQKLSELAADLCTRYNWGRLDHTRIRAHKEFANTACPGPYLWTRFNRIINTANKILDQAEVPPPTIPEGMSADDMIILNLNPNTDWWVSMLLAGDQLTHLVNGHHVSVMRRAGVPEVTLGEDSGISGEEELSGILYSVFTTNDSPFAKGLPSQNEALP